MTGSVYCLSLGCFKNRVDSERILGALHDAGFEPVDDVSKADICVVNTCGFLRDAVEENISAILDAAELKESGQLEKLVVFGCLVNRYGAGDLRESIPEVDAWIECEDYRTLVAALSSMTGREEVNAAPPKRRALPTLSNHTRYLKLSEGCANSCSYCKIPSIRGGLRSHTIPFLVQEAESLVAEGAREICLVAQDLTAYGNDLGDSDNLIALFDALESSLPEDIWLRLLYLQPMNVTKTLLRRVAEGRQILPYLDIPIQHASAKILASMNRGMSPDEMAKIFSYAREIRPDFALRTTCMVGYPGETRKDFETLLKFLSDVRFDRVGAFIFSPEDGTIAAEMPNQVGNRTKKSRLERLMSLQEEISSERQALFAGQTMDVMVDCVVDDGLAEGRTFREAPEVDGVVEIELSPNREHVPEPGDIIAGSIIETYEHDMRAREV